MKERIFIQKAKDHVNLEEFIRKQFRQVKCSKIEVQYTPIVTRIIIHTVTPGLVIGTGGERIRETVELLKQEFSIENPQIDVQKIENPNLDPNIVAQSIIISLENGVNFKRLGNFYVQKIMDAGAIGCEIVMSGKFSGQRARRERFTAGYLKKCGETSDRYVSKGFAIATPKLGNTGVTVKIMLQRPTRIIKEAIEEAVPEAEPKKIEKKKKPTKKEAKAVKKDTKKEEKPEEAAEEPKKEEAKAEPKEEAEKSVKEEKKE